MYIAVTILFGMSLLFIFLFSMGQLHLTWVYLRLEKTKTTTPEIKSFPHVTIQLPLYNEKYVVERLLESVAKIKYPKDKLEIQVLDDSTDETTSIVKNKIESIRETGINIVLLHRTDRVGFKAGALQNGLEKAKGEFIAIFDADFIPGEDFLMKTLPYFENKKVGMVQTRWSHLNKNYSLLTQLQSFGLDAHFSIEQSARKAAGSFINFNGTCGVWRKKCIEDAGGWSFDTLTEDLDLSYRAQLNGWEFKYMEDFATPGELPVIMQAIKSQQYRWNKGAAETARKLFLKVLTSKLSLTTKIHAFFHLFNSSVFVSLFIAAFLSIPMLYIKRDHPEIDWVFHAGMIFFLGFLSISFFYWIATKRFHKKSPGKKFASLFPQFLIVSMGLSLHNGLAVMEGLLGKKTPFIRTPKFNVINKSDKWNGNTYIKQRLTLLTMLEGLLCVYFIFGIVAGIMMNESGMLFFHILLVLGFGSVFYFSVKPIPNA